MDRETERLKRKIAKSVRKEMGMGALDEAAGAAKELLSACPKVEVVGVDGGFFVAFIPGRGAPLGPPVYLGMPRLGPRQAPTPDEMAELERNNIKMFEDEQRRKPRIKIYPALSLAMKAVEEFLKTGAVEGGTVIGGGDGMAYIASA